MKKRVTLDDIAAACGTSSASVSLALRNRPGVSRQRRAEILRVANELGYIAPGRDARGASATMRTIALIFRTPSWTAERAAPALNHFYSWVLTGIQDGANQHQLNLSLGTIPVDVDNGVTTLPNMLASQPLDGVLLVGAFYEETVRAVIERVGTDRIPMVLVDNQISDLGVDSVTSDHRQGMVLATNHLIASGHRAIGFAGLPRGADNNFDLRREGYADAMRAAGLPEYHVIVDADGDDPRMVEAIRRDGLTALACANDHTATLVLRAARRAGLEVPADLSLIGYDDTAESQHSVPMLSTMAVDKPALGRLATKVLDYRLEWPETAPIQVTVGTRLVERQSVRRLGADKTVPEEMEVAD